ncbi:hypothetical protein AB4Y45_34940 [Paraburkholderia sp. EG287A]|uniref:hypothetical protein n=1 Tax=Paraburkholderia sp. EG287A TaxID=3237012 RepID=UPI0034D3230E
MNIANKSEILTPQTLLRALSAIADGATEAVSADALVNAATLVQDAILSEQSCESFSDALAGCPEQYAPHLSAVMARAVEFHQLADGGRLGLWMLPVVLGSNLPMPEVMVLSTATLQHLRMTNALMQQLGLAATPEVAAAAVKDGTPLGWAFVLPKLYSYEAMNSAETGELIRLPHKAREFVRGERKRVNFEPGEERKTSTGAGQLYFLPFVAYHPAGYPVEVPQASEALAERMTRWIRASLPVVDGVESEVSIRVATEPHPFTVALAEGTRLRRYEFARDVITKTIASTGVEANGIAALVAPYAVENESGEIALGVSLVSRLTNEPLGTIQLPVETDDGSDEVAMTTYLLKQMGMQCTEHRHRPINTFSCQHCGNLQLSYPSRAVVRRGVEPSSVCHH